MVDHQRVKHLGAIIYLGEEMKCQLSVYYVVEEVMPVQNAFRQNI
jgi:hypothetical protein